MRDARRVVASCPERPGCRRLVATPNALPTMKYDDCIDACSACVIACEHCAASCLREGDVEKMTDCIRLDHSCADICALAVREMARESEFASQVCAVCADICQACGDECAMHEPDHCQQCADACHRCAEECRKMSSLVA